MTSQTQEKIVVVANRNLNLHTGEKDSRNGTSLLVRVPARRPVRVPVSVKNHPQWKMLIKGGTIHVLKDSFSQKAAVESFKNEEEAKKAQEKARAVQAGLDADESGDKQDQQLKSLIPQGEDVEINTEEEEEEGK
jgi:hypothetical protein